MSSRKEETVRLLQGNDTSEKFENRTFRPDGIGTPVPSYSGASSPLLANTSAVTDSDFNGDEVFDTKEVVKLDRDTKKVTYTRKISVGQNKRVDQHCHSHTPTTRQDTKSRNKLILASVLCLGFMIVEIVGGLLAGSLAIISDAAHLLTDFASFMISLMAIYLASRPATQRFNYGWHRAEILGAFTSIIMLWVLTGVLAYEAVTRIIDDDYTIDANIMLITAGTGVAFNLILGTTLHQHSHSHGGHGHSHGGHDHSHGGQSHSHGGSSQGHGHSHTPSSNSTSTQGHSNNHPNRALPEPQHQKQQTPQNLHIKYGSLTNHNINEEKNAAAQMHISIENGSHEVGVNDQGHQDKKKKEKNINVKAAFIHVVGDLLQSIGVLVAAYIIYYKPEWKIADPICTFLFSLIVVVTTISIMKDIVVVLMEGKPRSLNFADVRDSLLSVEKVKDTHNLRMWSLTMDKVALSVHLVVEEDFDAHEVLKNASNVLRSQYNIMDITIQIEEYVEDMDDCNECVGPS